MHRPRNNKLHFIIANPSESIPDSESRFNGLVTKVRIGTASLHHHFRQTGVHRAKSFARAFREHPVDSRGRVRALTRPRRRSLAVIAHTSTTQLLAARCGIIYPII